MILCVFALSAIVFYPCAWYSDWSDLWSDGERTSMTPISGMSNIGELWNNWITIGLVLYGVAALTPVVVFIEERNRLTNYYPTFWLVHCYFVINLLYIIVGAVIRFNNSGQLTA